MTSADLPIDYGGKLYLINADPKHKHRDKPPHRLSNWAYLENHYSTDCCIKLAEFLLEKYGFKGSLEIKYST